MTFGSVWLPYHNRTPINLKSCSCLGCLLPALRWLPAAVRRGRGATRVMASPFEMAAANALLSRSIPLPASKGLLRLDALPETDEECTREMVEALVARVNGLQKEVTESRKRTSAATVQGVISTTTPATQGVTAATHPAKKAKLAAGPDRSEMARKRLAASVKQALKGQKFFGYHTEREAKFEDAVTEEELRAIFLNGADKGTLVQPTPANNPKSNVFIIEVGGSAFERIAGMEGKELKGELWRQGGIGRFGAVKGKKLGSISLAVRGATIKWSKNQSKLSATVRIASGAGSSSGGFGCDSDDDGYGGFGGFSF